MWRRIRALIVKELLALWKDRKTRYVLIAPPIIQMILFANAATYEVTGVALGVWNEDRAHLSAELLHRFEDSAAFKRVANFEDPAAVAAAISAEQVKAVLHIGPTFSADVLAGRPATIQLLLDGRRSNTALIVQGYAAEIVDGFNRERLMAAGIGSGVALENRAWFNPNFESKWFILPGLTVILTTVASLLITALSVARERELGTFEQLLVTPLRPMEILIGKTAPGLIVGFVEANVIAAIAVYGYGVPFIGQILLFHAAITIFVLSAIGIGLVISSIAKTQQQSILGVFLFLSPAIILSGFATPIANMPRWSQLITYVDPIRYMLVVARGVFLQDISWALALDQLAAMAAIAAVTLSYATWLFRRKLQ